MWRQYHIRAQISDHKAVENIFKNPPLVAPPVTLVLDDGDTFFVGALGHIDHIVGVGRPEDTAST